MSTVAVVSAVPGRLEPGQVNSGFPSVAANPKLFAARPQVNAWPQSGDMAPSMAWQLRRLEGWGVLA